MLSMSNKNFSPVIKSLIAEKEKTKELDEVHRNVVLLLNIGYKGDDDLEKQCKFFATSHFY